MTLSKARDDEDPVSGEGTGVCRGEETGDGTRGDGLEDGAEDGGGEAEGEASVGAAVGDAPTGGVRAGVTGRLSSARNRMTTAASNRAPGSQSRRYHGFCEFSTLIRLTFPKFI